MKTISKLFVLLIAAGFLFSGCRAATMPLPRVIPAEGSAPLDPPAIVAPADSGSILDPYRTQPDYIPNEQERAQGREAENEAPSGNPDPSHKEKCDAYNRIKALVGDGNTIFFPKSSWTEEINTWIIKKIKQGFLPEEYTVTQFAQDLRAIGYEWQGELTSSEQYWRPKGKWKNPCD